MDFRRKLPWLEVVLFVFSLIGSEGSLFCSEWQCVGETEQVANGNICNSMFILFSSFCKLTCYNFEHFGQVGLGECWDMRWTSSHRQLLRMLIRVKRFPLMKNKNPFRLLKAFVSSVKVISMPVFVVLVGMNKHCTCF